MMTARPPMASAEAEHAMAANGDSSRLLLFLAVRLWQPIEPVVQAHARRRCNAARVVDCEFVELKIIAATVIALLLLSHQQLIGAHEHRVLWEGQRKLVGKVVALGLVGQTR